MATPPSFHMNISTWLRARLPFLSLLMASIFSLATSSSAQTAPTWASVQRVGATGTLSSSNGYSIALATDGSQYITGRFEGIIVLGSLTLSAGPGTWHHFLAKYSTTGAILWARQLDGNYYITSKVAVDAAGNAYLAGYFTSVVTIGATTLTSSSTDSYLVKYDAQGVQQWVRQGGGAGSRIGGLATDASGNVAITGDYTAPVAFGGQPLSGGGIFYYKFSPSGTIIQASRVSTGGNSYALTLDGAGNAYLAGQFSGTATFGATPLVSAGSFDVFLCKLDVAGNMVWARRDGGVNADAAYAVAVDGTGNPFVGGNCNYTTSNGVPNGGIYLARFTSQGNLMWARQTVPYLLNSANGVAYDGHGGYLVTGDFVGTTMFGNISLTASHQRLFVARYDGQGNAVWAGMAVAVRYQTDGNSIGNGIAVDSNGDAYITGTVLGTATFGTVPVPANPTDTWDAFVAKLIHGGTITATRPATHVLALNIYPNPTTSHTILALPAGGGRLVIFDALGRTVREQLLPPIAGACEVNLAGLAPGFYQLRATLGNGQVGAAQLVVR